MLHRSRLGREINIVVVGAGGTGSHVLHALARMELACRALDLGYLKVLAVDPDTVSETNVARQLFLPAELGQNKACALVNRIKLIYGFDWRAYPCKLSEIRDVVFHSGVVIGCVDNAAARKSIYSMYKRSRFVYWLDFGNGDNDGQAILGCRYKQFQSYLPSVAELFPSVLQKSKEDDEAPSCSLAESLARQDLFVNQALVTAGLQILWNLIRHGSISYHGIFMSLTKGKVSPLPVDPDTWKRMTA